MQNSGYTVQLGLWGFGCVRARCTRKAFAHFHFGVWRIVVVVVESINGRKFEIIAGDGVQWTDRQSDRPTATVKYIFVYSLL